MKSGSYLKLVGLEISGIEAKVVVDKNLKDACDVAENLKECISKHEHITWLILPCYYKIN